MSQTALKGASVFTPNGLACVDDTLYPAITCTRVSMCASVLQAVWLVLVLGGRRGRRGGEKRGGKDEVGQGGVADLACVIENGYACC